MEDYVKNNPKISNNTILKESHLSGTFPKNLDAWATIFRALNNPDSGKDETKLYSNYILIDKYKPLLET